MLSKGHKLAQGKPWVPREKDVLASCKQIARLHEGAGHLVCIRLSVGGIPRGNGQQWSRNMDMKGITDLVVLITGGPVLWVEVKAEDGRLSEDQKEFARRLARVGHPCRVVRSVQEFERLLAEYGVPPLTLVV